MRTCALLLGFLAAAPTAWAAEILFTDGPQEIAGQKLQVKPTRTAMLSSGGGQSAVWADLPGFEINDENRRLWEPAPQQPDWQRAEPSARYVGIALSKVQRWLHECCLPIRDPRSGLFRPTGAEWNSTTPIRIGCGACTNWRPTRSAPC